MKTLLTDFVTFFIVALLALWVQDTFSRTPEQRRADRRATEVMYESCMASCREGCGRPKKTVQEEVDAGVKARLLERRK